MPTDLEVRLIHVARKAAGWNDGQYRMVLRNAGGVESSKSLTQVGVENVMACAEDAGFRHTGKPDDYWRSRVAARGSLCGERLIHKIMSLIGDDFPYTLGGMCKRISKDRVDRLDRLTPSEALNMVEALKAIGARQSAGGAVCGA